MALAEVAENTRAAADAQAAAVPPRLLFIDNIRWTMIVLVLSMHASDTYSPFGNWYYRDRGAVSFGSALAFAAYQTFLQAFFMALLFFIAGYFAAPALDRKGRRAFLRDRSIRLGLPTLLYMFAIGPVTQYFLSHSWGRGGFAHQWLTHLRDGEWLSETGPMWFCAALLAFSILYALLKPAAPEIRRGAAEGPGGLAVIAFIGVMALATFLVRIPLPEDRALFNMHPGDFPQYALMFAAGIFAYRGAWLERVRDGRAVSWSLGPLLLALPLFALLIVTGGALRGETAAYLGGFNLISAGKCVWEALVCVGMSFGLLALYRRCFDRQNRLARLFSDNSFAVYAFHPPVLIALALLLHPLAAPPLVKAAVLTALATIATFSLSAAVIRRIPLLRRIL